MARGSGGAMPSGRERGGVEASADEGTMAGRTVAASQRSWGESKAIYSKVKSLLNLCSLLAFAIYFGI